MIVAYACAVRIIAAIALAGCAGPSTSAPAPAPIENRSAPAPADERTACEDVVEGPLYAPVIQYLVTGNEVAARTLREHRGELLRCYVERARYEPTLEGRVTVSFTIAPDGKPGRVRTVGFDAQIDRCLCERIRAIVFDQMAVGAKVDYPLVFKAGG